MGKGRCRGATGEISQTRQYLVSRQTNSCVLKRRRISPVSSGRFHFCHQPPARGAGLSSVAPQPPKGTLRIVPTINVDLFLLTLCFFVFFCLSLCFTAFFDWCVSPRSIPGASNPGRNGLRPPPLLPPSPPAQPARHREPASRPFWGHISTFDICRAPLPSTAAFARHHRFPLASPPRAAWPTPRDRSPRRPRHPRCRYRPHPRQHNLSPDQMRCRRDLSRHFRCRGDILNELGHSPQDKGPF